MAETESLAELTPDDTSDTDPKPKQAPKAARGRRGKKLRWRPTLRALHRDIGYFCVGLTLIYALSGLAVNHISDWDPNFSQIERTHQLSMAKPLPEDEQALATQVLSALSVEEKPDDVYRVDDTEVEITLASGTTYHVNPKTGKVLEQGQKERFLIRIANWLHLNRGKKAWTYIADGYAVFLLFLALSGLFMLPGRKGLIGRGAIIATVGAAVPILYVTLSGGP